MQSYQQGSTKKGKYGFNPYYRHMVALCYHMGCRKPKLVAEKLGVPNLTSIKNMFIALGSKRAYQESKLTVAHQTLDNVAGWVENGEEFSEEELALARDTDTGGDVSRKQKSFQPGPASRDNRHWHDCNPREAEEFAGNISHSRNPNASHFLKGRNVYQSHHDAEEEETPQDKRFRQIMTAVFISLLVLSLVLLVVMFATVGDKQEESESTNPPAIESE